jgi:hypothetical protein
MPKAAHSRRAFSLLRQDHPVVIDLLPVPQDRFACPCGQAELTVEGFHLPGMVPLAKTRCTECGRRFLAHLHTGFGRNADFLVDESDGEVHSTIQAKWYRDILVRALQPSAEPPAAVQRITRRALRDEVLLLNCLDPVYGHCLHRLFSFDGYRDGRFKGSVVAIMPRFLAWLAPDEIDEIWIVDAPLRQCNRANETVAKMTAELARQARQLSYADMFYGHEVDVSRYTHVAPFAAKDHDWVSPPRLTLNWREDRCWTIHGKPAERVAAIGQQHRLFCLLLERLREQVPDLDAAVTGYGRTGSFPSWVQDLRLIDHDTGMEQRWAQRYGQTHLSIGVHGSNMILPSALSLGAIELVETRFWPHILVTWEWVNRMSAADALARYRQLPLSSSISDIVSITLMQLRRMQGSAGYALMHRLRGKEHPAAIMVRHQGAFRYPDALVCRDEHGQPF